MICIASSSVVQFDGLSRQTQSELSKVLWEAVVAGWKAVVLGWEAVVLGWEAVVLGWEAVVAGWEAVVAGMMFWQSASGEVMGAVEISSTKAKVSKMAKLYWRDDMVLYLIFVDCPYSIIENIV